MTDHIHILIPMCPPSEVSPNYSGHWRPKANAIAGYRHRSFESACDALNIPFTPHLSRRNSISGYTQGPASIPEWLDDGKPVAVEYTVAWAPRRKRLDDTNFKASIKAAEDGVADAYGVNDRHFTGVAYEQRRLTKDERATFPNGYTIVTLRPLEMEMTA